MSNDPKKASRPYLRVLDEDHSMLLRNVAMQGSIADQAHHYSVDAARSDSAKRSIGTYTPYPTYIRGVENKLKEINLEVVPLLTIIQKTLKNHSSDCLPQDQKLRNIISLLYASLTNGEFVLTGGYLARKFHSDQFNGRPLANANDIDLFLTKGAEIKQLASELLTDERRTAAVLSEIGILISKNAITFNVHSRFVQFVFRHGNTEIDKVVRSFDVENAKIILAGDRFFGQSNYFKSEKPYLKFLDASLYASELGVLMVSAAFFKREPKAVQLTLLRVLRYSKAGFHVPLVDLLALCNALPEEYRDLHQLEKKVLAGEYDIYDGFILK